MPVLVTEPSSLLDTPLAIRPKGKRTATLAVPAQDRLLRRTGVVQEQARPALSVGLALALHLLVGSWWLAQQAMPHPEPPPPIEVSLVASMPAEKPQATAPAAPAPSPPAPAPEKPPAKPAPEKKVREKLPPKTLTPTKPKLVPTPKPVPKPETQADTLDQRAMKPTAAERESRMPSRRAAASAAAPARPAPSAPPREAPQALALASARPIYKPSEPAYPPIARRRGWTGTPKVKIKIAGDGSVQEVTLATSSGYEVLDEAALAIARKFRFIPLKPGQKRDAETSVQVIKFRIEDSDEEEKPDEDP
jgi:protein TonB